MNPIDPPEGQTIIQISWSSSSLYVLCNDGSIWRRQSKYGSLSPMGLMREFIGYEWILEINPRKTPAEVSPVYKVVSDWLEKHPL